MGLVKCLHTVIRGITAPAAMEAMSDTIMMSVWVLFAYRNNAKNPTLSLGASVCLSIICFSCSLRPEVSVFAPSSDDDTASSFSVSTPLPGGDSILSVAAFAAAEDGRDLLQELARRVGRRVRVEELSEVERNVTAPGLDRRDDDRVRRRDESGARIAVVVEEHCGER